MIACFAILGVSQACGTLGGISSKGHENIFLNDTIVKPTPVEIAVLPSGDSIVASEWLEVKEAFQAVYGVEGFKSLLKDPLAVVYDSVRIEYHKRLIGLFDYENDKDLKRQYDIYYPMLENYGRYNEEMVQLIETIVVRFELLEPDVPNIEYEKEFFEESKKNSAYYNEYRYKKSANETIKYLDEVIKDTESLFEDPSLFTKENFEKQLERLGKK